LCSRSQNANSPCPQHRIVTERKRKREKKGKKKKVKPPGEDAKPAAKQSSTCRFVFARKNALREKKEKKKKRKKHAEGEGGNQGDEAAGRHAVEEQH